MTYKIYSRDGCPYCVKGSASARVGRVESCGIQTWEKTSLEKSSMKSLDKVQPFLEWFLEKNFLADVQKQSSIYENRN